MVIEYVKIIITAILGILVGFYIRKTIGEGKINNAEELAKKIIEDANRDAETHKKEVLLEAKEEIHKIRVENERESRERRTEIQKLERRLLSREETLDKKSDTLEKKEESLNKKSKSLSDKEIQKLSGLTSEEAKELLLNDIKKEIAHESAILVKEMENKAKEEAEKKAKEIISCAIQKCAADHVAETTVTVVPLPNDEMKGRIDRKSVV